MSILHNYVRAMLSAHADAPERHAEMVERIRLVCLGADALSDLDLARDILSMLTSSRRVPVPERAAVRVAAITLLISEEATDAERV